MLLSNANMTPTPARNGAAEDHMRRVYEMHGGLVGCDELACLLRESRSQPLSILAHWLIERSIVSFSWRGIVHVPLFQFERPVLNLRPGMAAALRELVVVYDDTQVARWFIEPNCMLGGDLPITTMHVNPQQIVQAARVRRFT